MMMMRGSELSLVGIYLIYLPRAIYVCLSTYLPTHVKGPSAREKDAINPHMAKLMTPAKAGKGVTVAIRTKNTKSPAMDSKIKGRRPR